MSELWSDIDHLLGVDGPFAKFDSKFKPRIEQKAMARAVDEAISKGSNLLVEAGTGVGKTFAYLVPALLSDKQVVISTGTKNLQDQLFKRDLPALLKILELSPKIANLKGRNNYLCEYRLESALAGGRLPDPTAVKHLGLVNRWRDKTNSGDLSELSPLPENSSVIPFVTSTADNCLGQDCPFIERCFVASARERAKKAQILVVNHHILLADLVLKEDGFGELLPDTDVFIVDEAHQLAKTAYQFYGDSVSSRQLLELCRELELEYRTELTDTKDLMLDSQRLAKQVKDFRLCLPEYDTREDWQMNSVWLQGLRELHNKIIVLYDLVKAHSTRTKVVESCFERLVSMRYVVERFLSDSDKNQQSKNSTLRIQWFETMKSGFRLHSTPLDVANLFTQSRSRYAQSSWVLTSATLTVDGKFDHYIESLGWHDIECLQLESSFDYQQQAILYVPRGLPNTRSPQHSAKVVESAIPLIQAAGGRAFLLFTSHRALKLGAERLRDAQMFECLVQGEASKQELLDKFVSTPKSVLLATGSFWEGVDVSGDALILVVIDKLPFAPPDDPILNAKIRHCRNSGQNPFQQLQIPEAVLSMKQGCGRLIRSVTDRGVVLVGDSRLVAKDYGGIFVKSLPNMKRTRDSLLVRQFLADIINPNLKDKTKDNDSADG